MKTAKAKAGKGIFCLALCLLALLANAAFAVIYDIPDDELDRLLKEIAALETAASGQGAKDLDAADMATLAGVLLLPRSIAKGDKVHEVREAAVKAGMVAMDKLLKDKQEAIEELAKKRFATRQGYYFADHLALGDGVWNDLTQKIADLSKLLDTAHAISFLASADAVESNFWTYYPGYAGQRAVNFGGEFKSRMAEWENYAFGTLLANNKEAMDLKDNLLNLLSKLNDATGSLTAVGYRQYIQARNQIYLFVAQQVANMRLDVMRQIEAQARIAANKQQKRTNAQVAFGKAVPALRAQSAGKVY
ncbi:MAG: hypothetical protein LBO82_10390 [Synergistaceae bacterium]|jgi:hypothetical protein|nr:hypothetical protein [Synergistaceae bacterium]